MRFKLIAAFVDPSVTESLVAIARKNGATGDVIIPGRGQGVEATKFFGVSIDNKTEVVLLVVEEHVVDNILDCVSKECNLCEPGRGIMIVLNIDRVAGLEKQIVSIKDRLKDECL
jgi:nitrogen regulatory protein P-II 1